MEYTIPNLSLVVLVGPSGSGKSSFAKKHFLRTEVISSDFCRGLVSDDENDQTATTEAFDLLHTIVRKRLKAGRLTVIDATNVQAEARLPLVNLAREFHCLPVALVFDLPEKLCQERNKNREDRDFGPHVIRRQSSQLGRSLRNLKHEGFRHIHIFRAEEEVNECVLKRVPLWNDRKEEVGPFDIIGDVHGCADELEELLGTLGYQVEKQEDQAPWQGPVYRHPEGRRVVFLGDLVDRGPKIIRSLTIARNMVHAGFAFCVPGNHEMKFLRKLRGKDVKLTHGLQQTMNEVESLDPGVKEMFIPQAAEFMDGLISHYVFDKGRLVVAHAGLKEELQGRGSGKVREFCLYGETTGETDEFGLPVRYNWAAEYRGKAMMVYGHTPVPNPEWLNHTVCIDNGCVYGGKLTALRYPEREFVSVPAKQVYCEPVRPFLKQEEAPSNLSAQHKTDDLLDMEDVLGKRIISTRLHHTTTIREENAIAALEIMSRFAVNPKWLIYLPPTMSPSETSQREGYLEYPDEAFKYFQKFGVGKVICEEKHMGSRAVVVVCRSEEAALKSFGIENEGIGVIYTRTGRPFFKEQKIQNGILARLQQALTEAHFWEEFQSDWFCLDCELLPWSAKALELLQNQYAAVGSAGKNSLDSGILVLKQAISLGNGETETGEHSTDLKHLLGTLEERRELIEKFVTAYRQYCWDVQSVDDYKLAPFHILASEGVVHADKTHEWHMQQISTLRKAGGTLFKETPYRIVDLENEASRNEAMEWWLELTGKGGEGMVVKPESFILSGKKGLGQPALKCRGKEYLRIIYGPEYSLNHNLERLRARGLSTKRSLALREFALGIEALERFVRKEPLRKVHECVFGVLALESEPVDPRL